MLILPHHTANEFAVTGANKFANTFTGANKFATTSIS
jgi:hypothetical protein